MQSDMYAEAAWHAIEDAQTGPVHAPKTANFNEKTWRFTTSYKDDGSKIAQLEQQISQKMILLRSTVTFRQCAAN